MGGGGLLKDDIVNHEIYLKVRNSPLLLPQWRLRTSIVHSSILASVGGQ